MENSIAAQSAWRREFVPPHGRRQMTMIGKPGAAGNRSQRQVSLDYKLLRLLEAERKNVLMRRFADRLFLKARRKWLGDNSASPARCSIDNC
ncbi:hypothetical protein QW131_17710 [Roseibium salinum]|nr:hypothetical protein [Roseibium salinum]